MDRLTKSPPNYSSNVQIEKISAIWFRQFPLSRLTSEEKLLATVGAAFFRLESALRTATTRQSLGCEIVSAAEMGRSGQPAFGRV